jgi:glycosyltransferase involved in cell wall biosynthesis
LAYKIQMIAPTSFFADTGCHVRILEEIRALQDAGHSVTLCTYHMGNGVEGFNIKRSLDVPWKKGVQVGSSRHKIYFDAMLSLRSLQVNLQDKPDIIHAHIHEGALIGSVLKGLHFGKTPVIFDYQGSMTSEMLDHNFLKENGIFYKPTVQLERVINGLADRIVTSSHNAAHILQTEFQVPAAKVVTLADRVNCDVFRPAETDADRAEIQELREKLGIPADRKVVVYLGLLAPYQGTNLLLEAARMLKEEAPDAYFVVMGYPGVESYSRMADELGIADRVIFPGRIAYQDAPKYLRLGDVAVAPKMSKTEGAGKIHNYMAMGLPTVTFSTPVSREILGDLGVYAAYGNARSLADNIKNLLNDDSRRATLSAALRRRALSEKGWDDAVRQLEQIYAQALLKRRKQTITRQELGAAADSGTPPAGVTVAKTRRLVLPFGIGKKKVVPAEPTGIWQEIAAPVARVRDE